MEIFAQIDTWVALLTLTFQTCYVAHRTTLALLTLAFQTWPQILVGLSPKRRRPHGHPPDTLAYGPQGCRWRRRQTSCSAAI